MDSTFRFKLSSHFNVLVSHHRSVNAWPLLRPQYTFFVTSYRGSFIPHWLYVSFHVIAFYTCFHRSVIALSLLRPGFFRSRVVFLQIFQSRPGFSYLFIVFLYCIAQLIILLSEEGRCPKRVITLIYSTAILEPLYAYCVYICNYKLLPTQPFVN